MLDQAAVLQMPGTHASCYLKQQSMRQVYGTPIKGGGRLKLNEEDGAPPFCLSQTSGSEAHAPFFSSSLILSPLH